MHILTYKKCWAVDSLLVYKENVLAGNACFWPEALRPQIRRNDYLAGYILPTVSSKNILIPNCVHWFIACGYWAYGISYTYDWETKIEKNHSVLQTHPQTKTLILRLRKFALIDITNPVQFRVSWFRGSCSAGIKNCFSSYLMGTARNTV